LPNIGKEKKILELDLTFTLALVSPADGGQPLLHMVCCCHNLFILSAEKSVEMNKTSFNHSSFMATLECLKEVK
jgi:hypothetical protein